MVNIDRAIRQAVVTGKVTLGEKETNKAAIGKKAKLIIVAENCPEILRERLDSLISRFDLPVFEFEGTSLKLGAICGKPFLVSMLGVIEAGESSVLELSRTQ